MVFCPQSVVLHQLKDFGFSSENYGVRMIRASNFTHDLKLDQKGNFCGYLSLLNASEETFQLVLFY